MQLFLFKLNKSKFNRILLLREYKIIEEAKNNKDKVKF